MRGIGLMKNTSSMGLVCFFLVLAIAIAGVDAQETTNQDSLVDVEYDHTLVAGWALIEYPITYSLNGGNNTVSNPASYDIESSAITLVNPVKVGYDFAGWIGTGLTVPTVDVTIPKGSTGDRSYTATWTPVDYSIGYDLAGGSVSGNPASYDIESSAITLVNPTRNGYTFVGWTGTGLSEATMAVTIPTGSTGDRSYTATWTETNYQVTYLLDGGSVDGQNPATYTLSSKAFTLNNPSKNGFVFLGWTYAGHVAQEKSVTIVPIEVLSDLTITAHWAPVNVVSETDVTYYVDHILVAGWTPTKYAITYNLGGGQNNMDNPATYNVETPTFSLSAPTKLGCDFLGWTWDGQDEPTTSVTISKGTMGAKEFTANWSAPKLAEYTVRHWQQNVSDDGYTEVAADKQAQIGTIGAMTEAVAKTYAGFAPKAISQVEISVSGTVVNVYYDRVTYTVSFSTGGGSPVDNQTVRYGATATKPTDPTRTGYTFSKWKNGNVDYNFSTAVTGSLSLTAGWTVVQYSISYTLNGGSIDGTNPTSYDIESKAFSLINPTKTGYTFAGWTGTGLSSASKSVTVPAGSTGNKAYTATWTPNTDTVYKVVHLWQNVDGNGYTDYETVNMTGTTAAQTNAVAKTYGGFTAKSVSQTTIAADGSTVVKIQYDRNSYTITFDSDGGSSVVKITAKYGATVAKPTDPT